MRGFLLAGPMLYAAIGAGALIVALSVGVKIQTSRLATCQTEFTDFKAEVKATGEAAAKAAKEREAEDLKLKEKTDADHKATVARLNRDLKRVRDDHARRSAVPAAPAGTKRPDLACFDRAELGRALRDYETEVVGLIGEGAAATVDLDAAKRWAQSLAR